MIDLYAVLEVNQEATEEELKKAFRRLAKQYHPDLHLGDKDNEAKFKEINEAYEILSNPKKRLAYDQKRKTNKQQTSHKRTSSTSPNRPFDMKDFGKSFENYFGFDPVVNGEKSKKGPMDTSEIFQKFMGFK